MSASARRKIIEMHEEITKLREQVAAQAAVIESQKEALIISVPMAFAAAIQNMDIEDDEAEEIHAIGAALAEEIPDDGRTVREMLRFFTSTLATPTDSTQILDEVRRAEREKCAKVCEAIYTNGDGAEGWLEIAANRIRAME